MGIIISENLVECVKMSEENSEDSQALINEAVELLIKVNDKYNHHYSNVSYWYLRRIYFWISRYRGAIVIYPASYYYHHYLVYLLIVLILLQD